MAFYFLRTKCSCRRAATAVLVVVTLPVLFGMAALTVDVGYLYGTRAELQNTADAAALASVSRLPNVDDVLATAKEMVERNYPNDHAILQDSEVRLGTWDTEKALFTEGGANPNAVQIFVQRSNANGNAVTLFFGGLLGINQSDVSALAIAAGEPNCFDRGIKAGRNIDVDNKIQFNDVSGDFCMYGHDGVTAKQVMIKNSDATLTIAALDDLNIDIDKDKSSAGTLKKMEANMQPKQAQRVSDLIDDIEGGNFILPSMSVVVLTGPVTFGTGGGEVNPQPNTAYVVNGNATIAKKFDGENMAFAVRGTLTVKDKVDMNNSASPASGALPLLFLATTDVMIGKDVGIDGGSVIGGRDVVFDHKLDDKKEPGIYGLSIEAGRDVVIGKSFMLKKLSLGFSAPVYQPASPELVQ